MGFNSGLKGLNWARLLLATSFPVHCFYHPVTRSFIQVHNPYPQFRNPKSFENRMFWTKPLTMHVWSVSCVSAFYQLQAPRLFADTHTHTHTHTHKHARTHTRVYI